MIKDKNIQAEMFVKWRNKYDENDNWNVDFYHELCADKVNRDTFEKHITMIKNKYAEYETIWRTILGFEK